MPDRLKHIESLIEELSANSSAVVLSTLTDGVGVLLPKGLKYFKGKLTGTGAVSANVSVQSSNTDSDYIEQFYFPLSGTDEALDDQTWESAAPYWRAVVTDLTGTGAAVTITVSV